MTIIKKILMVIPNFIKRKVFYHQMKKAIFETFNHADEWINMLTMLAVSVKDSTPEDVRKEFISTIAEKIHDDNNK